MTAKDLNLSLDRDLTQDRTGQSRQQGRTAAPLASASPRSKKPAKGRKVGPGQRQPWLATGLIASINILFLVIAGYWLMELPHRTDIPPTPALVDMAPDLALAVPEIQHRLDAIEDQLKSLRAAIDNPTSLPGNKDFDINAQLSDALRQQQEATESLPAAPQSVPSPRDWRINLGEFATPEEALQVQSKILSIAPSVSINSRADAGKTSYSVGVPGFEDRGSAELVAKQIMEKTSLNGLWVSKDT